jgi:single-strand DNA-binding protein
VIHATVVGRLGADPKKIPTDSGGCSFSVAADHGWGDKKSTTWVDVTVWGTRGTGLVGKLAKGSSVAIRGELWTEDRDGKRYLKMRADDVEFTGPPPGTREKPEPEAPADDIPF